MKRAGFTLAEVLITLGIVGVVSALVLPTFTTKMQTAKVGPRLAKAVAAFEQANIAILNDEQADELSATDYIESPEVYFRDALSTHMKGSYDSDNVQFISADGITYQIVGVSRNETDANKELHSTTVWGGSSGSLPHLAAITRLSGKGVSALMIDIDANNGPNSAGRDRFFFQMMDDGSLRPWGGSWDTNEEYQWQKACPKSSNGTVIYPYLCAGHVMENGLKVEYKASGSSRNNGSGNDDRQDPSLNFDPGSLNNNSGRLNNLGNLNNNNNNTARIDNSNLTRTDNSSKTTSDSAFKSKP